LGNAIKEMIEGFIEFFKNLEGHKKVGLIASTAIVVGVFITFFSWVSKSPYRIMYTNLNQEDSIQVTRFLKDSKIPYSVSENGKTIKIPEEKVEIWRLEIAKRGMKFSSTVGYEVFDKQSFGTTSFVQKINRQRALEGELVKTIKHLNGVKRARVHLSIPESSPFVTEVKSPTASVVLEVESSYSMTSSEIKGIAHLISASVERMRVEDVVILDSKGKKLSENMGDDMTAETANRVAFESKMNRKYEKQIEEILSRVVGDGKVIAKVAVTLDFTEKVETQTSYDNENTAVFSEVQNKEVLVGKRPSPQGVAGARSNLPGEAPQPGVPETSNNLNKEHNTRNFNVPKKVTRSRKPTANISRISAAVMVDGKRVALMKDGQPVLDSAGIQKFEYQAWSKDDLDNFKEIIGSTIGLNASREDSIVIKNMEFAYEDLTRADALARQKDQQALIRNLIQYAIIGAVLALFIFFVARPFIQWLTDNSIQQLEDFLPQTLEELENIQKNQKLPGLEDALPTLEEKINPEKLEGNMLKEKVLNLVNSHPDKAAQVVTNMMYAVNDDKKIA
jgi:flagellar M-ring protein FliF